jgi:glycogen debranching enzyme
MTTGVVHPLEILHGGGTALACAPDGELHADALHGFFAGDTRVLSTYRLAIAGHPWTVLARSRPGASSAQWDLQNPAVRVLSGDLEEGTVHLRLRRRVSGALHDDITVTSFADRAMAVRLTLLIDADFADVFQVKDRTMPPRLGVQHLVGPTGLTLRYERRGFRRSLDVRLDAGAGARVESGVPVTIEVALEPGRSWRCCVEAVPELDGRRIEFQGDPHAPAPREEAAVTVRAAPILADPFERGQHDLDRLAMQTGAGQGYVAAGAPWFMALFGRDTLVTSLMTGLIGERFAVEALAALGPLQARERDDDRDAQPGKIAHELREGELARFRLVPHTPYYGTHDAPALFVLALWSAFRWTGDRELLERHLPQASAALRWCRNMGDQDEDGLLEYRTTSARGYRNQGWKDAEDAILHEDGLHADLPIATVELQGYWYAALLAMAELLVAVGDGEGALPLRAEARRLQLRVEERFWMEEPGCYAMALDGHKRHVRSIGSNAGQLLWCGLPSPEHARRTAARLLAGDMFSGYGVRTLSAAHRRYNPLSYQRGSVWPHDNALIAAGLARYGLRAEAARVLEGVLAAAASFDQSRLPELFCGLARSDGPPVPYEKANVPQAWAAAAPILAAQVFLGLQPDVPRRRCRLWPWLPDWLPSLEVRGIRVGDGALDVRIARQGGETVVQHARHPTLEIEVGQAEAPLWGACSAS